MKSSRSALGIALVLALPVSVSAAQGTKKIDLAPGAKTHQVDVSAGSVKVNQVVLDVEDQSKTSVLRSSGSEAKVRMDNNGDKAVEAGVGVVLMDGDGNLVGAGSCGTKVGWLKAGERDTCTINFSYLFRNMKNAKTMVITLETRDKP